MEQARRGRRRLDFATSIADKFYGATRLSRKVVREADAGIHVLSPCLACRPSSPDMWFPGSAIATAAGSSFRLRTLGLGTLPREIPTEHRCIVWCWKLRVRLKPAHIILI